MAKISVDKLAGLSPLPKQTTLIGEKDGQKQEITLDIYPLTVDDKAYMKQMNEKLDSMDENDPVYADLAEDSGLELALRILIRSIDGITKEIIKGFPNEWNEQIIQAALSHEGVTKEQYDNLKVKALTKE